MHTVLLVDDDEMVSSMLRLKLSRDNFEVIVVSNGMEAKEKLKTIVPDIVVTDLMMPFFSGMELINHIRNELKLEFPILVLSSAGQEQSVLKAFEIGANDFVSKPFSPNELIVRIKKMIV